jgi:hypothetical protein
MIGVLSTHASNRMARVIYYGAASDAPKSAFVNQADLKVQEVDLDQYNFSKAFKLSPGATRLVFLPALLPENASIPAAAPFLDIPEEWTQVLIFAFEDKSNPIMPIRLKAMNASQDAFGPGKIIFINMSEMTVFGYVGDQKLLSKPHTTEIIENPRAGEGKYMLKLDSFKDDLSSRRRLIQQKCQYRLDERMVSFIVPLPAPRMVKIYSAPVPEF